MTHSAIIDCNKGDNMKYYKKLKVYKASNVLFDPENIKAYSHGWWKFVAVINGKTVVNNYGYSVSTRKHQSKVISLMGDLGINIDVFVSTSKSLDNSEWVDDAISNLNYAIKEIETKLQSNKRKRSLDESRLNEINRLQREQAKLALMFNAIPTLFNQVNA